MTQQYFILQVKRRNPRKSQRFLASASSSPAWGLRYGYAPLFKRNEFWHALGDNEIRGLVLEETGLANDSPTVTMIINSMKGVKKFATFEPEGALPEKPEQPEHPHVQLPASAIPPQLSSQSLGLNIGYRPLLPNVRG